MKKVLLASMLLFSATAFAQNGDGAQRRCGNDFAPYGLAGMTYAQVLDYVGQTHNDYQDYLLRELAAVKMDFTDTVALKRVVSEKSVQFFAPKGISFDPAVATLGLAKSTDFTFPISPKSYSPAAYEIIMALQELLRGYDANNEAAFFAQLAKLRADALNLPNETEVFVAGLPVTIAMYSFTYWKSNGQYWMDLLTPYNGTAGKMPLPSGEALREKKKCKVDIGNVGGADALGGYAGATGGGIAGPAGAVAGGVLGAATGSLGNLGNQIIKCYVSWWPF